MTNKINGIDVSECCCFENGFCLWIKKYYETGITPKCRQVKDCYFKKLKSLQEENKELKNRLKILDDEEFVYEVTEIEYNNFKKMNKYKQALEEIREIAEICMSKNIDNCYTCKFYNECEIEDAEIPTRDVCKLIKNKINEVLNE